MPCHSMASPIVYISGLKPDFDPQELLYSLDLGVNRKLFVMSKHMGMEPFSWYLQMTGLQTDIFRGAIEKFGWIAISRFPNLFHPCLNN